MDDDKHFEELKEKEIKRLTSPIIHQNGKNLDIEGNPVPQYRDGKYILEPNPTLLSTDEILKYAPFSDEASRVRLTRGEYGISDIWNVYQSEIFVLFVSGILILFFSAIISFLFFKTFNLTLILLILLIIIFLYIFFIHDYSDKNRKIEKNISNNDELLLLFESKEENAREIIEKRFPAPQLTNLKFNGVLDNCREVVESQIEILNTITPTEKTKPEIESRKKLIKQVISKVDDLTNELILSEENDLNEVIEEMDDLINSVKDYE